MKQLLLCPGYVRSMSDGNRHYISASQLEQLYRVDRRKNQVAVLENGIVNGYYKESAYEGWIRLKPLYGGNYEEKIKELGLK